MIRITWITTLILSLGALLGGCAETELVMHTAKQFAPQANAKASGRYKIGKPYKIAGIYYYPTVDYNYAETGVASWYGPKFHGLKTANGATFDMNEVTAAHRTLPLPSMVRVTNLRNGRSLKILVNDRGPFSRGRIIDLSRRSAQLLGVIRAGTAPVRVEIIADESRQLAAIARGKSVKPVSAGPSDDV
ncbi:MAG: septal ring lytic transglycosylase RlpA family protein, partial [Rhodospirillaceae bacterium]|nr:septal ring lytic transglycosylase RlpA family protein [Rhodospirillaceae bacterium]